MDIKEEWRTYTEHHIRPKVVSTTRDYSDDQQNGRNYRKEVTERGNMDFKLIKPTTRHLYSQCNQFLQQSPTLRPEDRKRG